MLAAAFGLALLHVLWMARFRWGYVVDWDEAGYMTIALQDFDALHAGLHDFVEIAIHGGGAAPPLAPLSAIPLLGLLGRSVDVVQLVAVPYFVLLVLSAYGLARRLVTSSWAFLAALCVGTAPVVSDYSRIFHFAIPAAALLTTALWALLRSEALRRTRWALVAGVLLGLMLLARTMTVAYIPGVALGIGIPLLVVKDDRGLRVRNFLLVLLVTAAVAAVWWLPNWSVVSGYLFGAGYGNEAGNYGTAYSVFSFDYWIKELKIVDNYIYLPLAATGFLVLVAAAASAASRLKAAADWRRYMRIFLSSDALLPAAVVLFGYLALTSTTNQGTAFPLPWIPALLVLIVAAAATVRISAIRAGLAALLIAVCALNLAMKNGLSQTLSEPVVADVPIVGRVTVLDGRDLLYAQAQAFGYSVHPPPARLPHLQKEWEPFYERVALLATNYAARRERGPYVIVASEDGFFSETRVELASVARFHRPLPAARILGPQLLSGGVNVADYYRQQFRQLSDNLPSGFITLLLTASHPPGSTASGELSPGAVARAFGFRPLHRITMPDGRTATLWRRTGTAAPHLTTVSPAEKASGVLPNTPIVGAFDTAMDEASVQAAFTLKRTSDGTPVGGKFSWYGKLGYALVFNPTESLAPGTQYTAMVTAAAKDLAGNPLPAAKTWRFTTTNMQRPAQDSNRPTP